MIGFYNYTVILTYIGLISTFIGITQVFEGNFMQAMFCLTANIMPGRTLMHLKLFLTAV